jgi:hypothetical protein
MTLLLILLPIAGVAVWINLYLLIKDAKEDEFSSREWDR